MMPKTKPTNYRRFRIFGWHIYITRNRLRMRDPKRSRLRTHSKTARLEAAGYRCELCGRHITLNCTLYHLLPVGAKGRNDIGNVRVICPECHEHVQHVGAYRSMLPLDDAPGATSPVRKGGES